MFAAVYLVDYYNYNLYHYLYRCYHLLWCCSWYFAVYFIIIDYIICTHTVAIAPILFLVFYFCSYYYIFYYYYCGVFISASSIILVLLCFLLSNNSIRWLASVQMSNPFGSTKIILVDAASCSFILFPNGKFLFSSFIDTTLHCILGFGPWGLDILFWQLLLSLFSSAILCFSFFNHF